MDYERAYTLAATLGERLERCLRERCGLRASFAQVLPLLAERAGARGVLLRTFGEDLQLTTFRWPEGFELPLADEVLARTGPETCERLTLLPPGGVLVARGLDVGGEWFGQAALLGPEGSGPAEGGRLAADLDVFCEKIDDLLYVVRGVREKHALTMRLGDALRHRVLGEGLRQAVAVLAEAVSLEKLLLVAVVEDGPSAAPHVQLFERGALALDTMGGLDRHPQETEIVAEARAYLSAGDPALLRRLGVQGAHEEILIDGIVRETVVGKVVATPRSTGFGIWERETLAVFAAFIRQRVVDFNKEWRTLAASFRPEDVTSLLRAPDYGPRFLAPREAVVAMLYADLSGFTRLSEQVLQEPSRVGALVEAWGRSAVDIVWSHGGVFDKMVGDCVIALFGPPFFDTEPGARLAAALRCARDIRDMTRRLPERPGFELLRAEGLGVATGINLAPLFVGRFGPNDNFTGFSRGMNNAARLQGCAVRDEILVMGEALASLPPGHGFAFGEERTAKVKNVAEPLRFRALV